MRVFLDTNVLVYANDDKDAGKHRIAKDGVVRAVGEDEGVISTQVLGEFASVALTKLAQSAATVMTQMVLFERFQVVPITPALIRRAIEIRETSRVNYW